MANSKAPKHDFAPAWLKVPDHDSWKPPGSKPSEQPSRPSRPSRREDYYNGYVRQDYCMPLQRQHSFDNYYDDRRYPPQKFRHRSFDDDYYGYGVYGGYYDGYAYDKFAGPHYRSHPGLYQDSKYTHPNAARYGPPGPQVNGGGAYPPPYYSPYMYDYYQGGPYYGGSFTGNKRRPPLDKSDGRYRNGRERRHSDSRSGSKQNSLDDDFPSLNGEVDGEKENSGGNKTGSTLGAWGKSPTGTVNGTSRNARDDRSDDFVHLSSKLLNKSGVRGYKDSFVDKELPLKSVPSSGTRRDINSNSTTVASTPQPNHLDHNGHGGDIQPVENGVVESCRDDNDQPDMDEHLVCGINDLSMSSVERSLLASSVEAEQRLLREMGWNEADEEEYVITEDDLREFQKLKQMKQQKNGLQCSWTKVWSAQHIGVLPEAPLEKVTDSPCSSSDDDSDLN